MENSGENIVDICRRYLEIPSVIGFEEPFFKALQSEYQCMGLRTESLYNRYGRRILLAVSNTNFEGNKLVSAHIDRHGMYKILDPHLIFFSQAYDKLRDTEYAAHAIKRINFDKEEFVQNHLLRVCNYFVGEKMRAYDPVNFEFLGEATIESSDICVIDEYLTFDLKGLDDLSQLSHQIIPIAFVPHTTVTEGEIIGQIDNALSVAIITHLFQSNVPFTAILTTDEEIGESWQFLDRYFTKHGQEPKNLLVLDTSPYSENLNGSYLQEKGGVVLRYADNYAPFNRNMTHQLKSICEGLSIPYDFKDLNLLQNGNDHLGSTELGKLILKSNKKYMGTTLQIPTNEYHTNRERATQKSIENTFKLAKTYLESNTK